jgi:sec-independent protein translocase protein TatB
MFDVGFAELFLLALIGLLVLGPERLPRVANNIGTFIRKARLSWISLRNTIQSELAEADLSAPLKQAGDELKQISKDLTDMTAVKPADKESADKAPDTSEKEAPAPDPDSKNDDA